MSISFIARAIEKILKFNKLNYMDSLDEVSNLLKNNRKIRKPIKSIFKSFDFNGMQVFCYGDENSKNTVIYIHGGAYVGEINIQHHLYCLMLSRKLGVNVLAPVYPLAPLITL